RALGLLLVRFRVVVVPFSRFLRGRDGPRGRIDADRLAPIDVVLDPRGSLLPSFALTSLFGLVFGLALQLFRALRRAESRHSGCPPGRAASGGGTMRRDLAAGAARAARIYQGLS